MLLKLLRSVFRPRSRVDPLVNRGLALRKEGRWREAEQVLREAVTKFPRDAVAATNLAIVLLDQDQAAQGASWLQRALEYDPRFAPAHYNLANLHRASGRRDQALAHYQSAVDADPGFAPAREEFMHCLLEVCDWDRAELQAAALRGLIARRPETEWMRYVSPLTALYLGLDPALRKRIAAFHARECAQGVQPIVHHIAAGDAPARLRIGYLSRDFRDHPIGHLLGNVFALHDRTRFEVFAFSYGPDDGSVYCRSIAAAADHFIDAHAMTDGELAAHIVQAGIHVLIDLAGHTTGNRLAVLARRPAPVQAHYLGFPATTGAPYVDYFITDRVATPPALAAEFTEQLAYMPRCFMVSDGADAASRDAVTRAAEGLAEDAVVYCNFNNASRITRDNFRAWLDILRAVPSSVLWLHGGAALTLANLHKEAQCCGMDPARVVFAQRAPTKAAHLARLALADLALDTFGWYNGHSSTSDALWGGVPVLTTPAASFAGRVAASLVNAAELPELAVRDRDEYVATAIRLGNDRAQLAALKRKLAASRHTAPFFDTRCIVRDLEAVYRAMWNASRDGKGARTIDIAAESA